jgi:GNAT superfamily N-acetyltransferase
MNDEEMIWEVYENNKRSDVRYERGEYTFKYKNKDINAICSYGGALGEIIRLFDPENNEQIAFIDFKKGQKYNNHDNGVEIGTVAVSKNYQRQGYSKLLLKIVEDYAKKNNLIYIYVEFATSIMLRSLTSMFNIIKIKKDKSIKSREAFKDIIIKL